MKVTALAALSVLAVLPAEAAQRHQVNGSSALTCDNDGHCTTFNVSALTSGLRKTRPAIKNAAAATQHPSPALDANSNSDTKKTRATVQPRGKLDGEVILLYTAPTRTACHDATWRSMVFPKSTERRFGGRRLIILPGRRPFLIIGGHGLLAVTEKPRPPRHRVLKGAFIVVSDKAQKLECTT